MHNIISGDNSLLSPDKKKLNEPKRETFAMQNRPLWLFPDSSASSISLDFYFPLSLPRSSFCRRDFLHSQMELKAITPSICMGCLVQKVFYLPRATEFRRRLTDHNSRKRLKL
jgi:hypothetical protein